MNNTLPAATWANMDVELDGVLFTNDQDKTDKYTFDKNYTPTVTSLNPTSGMLLIFIKQDVIFYHFLGNFA